ncbi:MAG: mannose-6-phosphate isomerase, class I [Streptosporangiales bacterium]|nr:mannose-6-phosphate isomerase, class I [Streptosporangiales bacterium]MBO0890841.1 mannose-6-phosphate isomerase, class I [Acidothermales bacterium]
MRPIARLEGTVQPYAWGSHTFIPQLLGRRGPTPDPQAELWLGAHPRGPSLVDGRPLADLVAERPEAVLGPAVTKRFGPRLPFLLKVLAADAPLSLQVHPSAEQARTGYAAENARGVPLDAPHRNYRDDWPKPELIVALTPLEALCGFRPPRESHEVFAVLVSRGAEALRPYADGLATLDRAAAASGLADLVGRLLREPRDTASKLVADADTARGSAPPPAGRADDWRLVARLAAAYPDDPGVLVALLLNHVRLAPGEGVQLPAGNMHAYLDGAGVEVMASSDNVLRGGLTDKHVDVGELLRVLDATPRAVDVLRPRPRAGVTDYGTDAPYFRLSSVEPGAGEVRLPGGAPQILLCVAGSVTADAGADHVRLSRGDSAFVPAETAAVSLAGEGHVFRATVPPPVAA